MRSETADRSPEARIIALWPSHQALADDVGVTRNAVALWAFHGVIPPYAWRRLVAASRRRRLGVTLEYLATLAEQRGDGRQRGKGCPRRTPAPRGRRAR